jgi:hypothetical protein
MGLRSHGLKKGLVSAAFLAVCLTYLVRQAWLNPEVEFLWPSRQGSWIVHPRSPIRFRGFPTSPEATFRHAFAVDRVPATYPVRVAALRGFRLRLNGVARAADDGATWKTPTRLDLAPWLQAGTNVLEIAVGGPSNPPALRVEGPPEARTGERWSVSQRGGRPVPAALALRSEDFLRGGQSPLAAMPGYRWWRWALWLHVGFTAFALLPKGWRPWRKKGAKAVGTEDADGDEERRPDAPPAAGRPLWRRLSVHAACASVLLPALIVQVHNARTYPYTRSLFDAKGHVEYLRYVAANWRTPLATDGWEMFQPPLYYFAAAGVYRLAGGPAAEPRSLEAVQAFTAVSGLFTLGVAYLLLGLMLPGRPVARALGLAFAAMLPMGLYMNPMITNEVFAGAAIGLALLATCWVAARPAGRPLLAALAGTMGGLGLLAKYTGLFVCAAGALLLGLRAWDRPRERRRWLALAAYVAAAFAVAGWLFVRNAQRFGDPFVGNWDARSGHHYEQPPGYRTLGYYTRFGSVFTHVPARSRFASFWDGQYGSAWTDSHHAFLSHKDPATARLGVWLYWLALLPTAAMLAGFAQSVVGIWRRGWDHPRTVLAATTVLTLTGVIAFTLETPTYSTIKAFFCLSLIPALALFAGKGLDGMRARLGRLRWAVYANLAALYGLAVYTFWYRG